MKQSTPVFVGLDDSKELIQVGVAEGTRTGEVRDLGAIPNRPEAVIKLVRKLGRPRDLYFVYEAGPCGYGLYRQLVSLLSRFVWRSTWRQSKRPAGVCSGSSTRCGIFWSPGRWGPWPRPSWRIAEFP